MGPQGQEFRALAVPPVLPSALEPGNSEITMGEQELTSARPLHRNAHPRKSNETERRFLVTAVPAEYLTMTRALVRQGYLTPAGATPEIRVRSELGMFEITVKGSGTLTRQETPISITEDEFEELWPLTMGARIEKQRIRIPYGELTIELDFYENSDGLITAEVEFPSPEAAAMFEPPSWFGREITDDLGLRNRALAR